MIGKQGYGVLKHLIKNIMCEYCYRSSTSGILAAFLVDSDISDNKFYLLGEEDNK